MYHRNSIIVLTAHINVRFLYYVVILVRLLDSAHFYSSVLIRNIKEKAVYISKKLN